MSTPNCSCLRKECDEAWHDAETGTLMEEVTITVPRFALERAAYLAQLMDGAWSGPYRALAPHLLFPKPDPSIGIEADE